MSAEAQNVIYTIGHSTLSSEEFVARLQAHGIRCLVDIRRFPTSRKHPQFTREHLSETLQQGQIRYIWQGERLGGYRTGGYERYMTTEAFAAGLQELTHVARQQPTAIMCAELLFFRCHRRFVAQRLVEQGWKVLHILDQGRIYEHKRGEKA